MERIMIIGCGGAGKSTLARQLGEITGLPVVHLDKLFWHSGWVESTREEIDEKILRELQKEKWIIDGNYMRTMPMRMERCDAVIFLDFSRITCVWGILKRYLTNIGKVRPDMPEGCIEKIDWEFFVWVWNFNKTKGEKIYRMLNEAEGVETIVLKNRRAVKLFLERVQRGEYDA